MAYVIAQDGAPLDPCTNAIARLLLKDGNAKVRRREPFTIKLTRDTGHETHPCTLGIDAGSGTLGAAAVNARGEVLYASEVTVRNDIKKKMTRRRTYRRMRRHRKTPHRKARFDNRAASKREGRLNATMKSKLGSHLKEIRFVGSILPVGKVVIEGGQFDMAAMDDPRLLNEKTHRWGYQKGFNYGYENRRKAVLARDGYACRQCGGRSGDSRLEVHHVIYRSQGGTDTPKNLVTLCHACHAAVHAGTLELTAKPKNAKALNHATQMNVIRSQLLKALPGAAETYGYVTSENRKALGHGKSSHWLDACVIASGGRPFALRTENLYRKRCVPEGDFQRRKGARSETAIPKGKVMGFRKFDKVRYRGEQHFVKGRMSAGYARLMGIDGNEVKFTNPKTPKLKGMKRMQARTSWIVATEKLTLNAA